MLVAKCALCNHKTTLQACEVCEEAKCFTCIEQHWTEYQGELKQKWLSFESKFQVIEKRIDIRRERLMNLRKTIDEQLDHLTNEYQTKLVRFMQEYIEFRREMDLSKNQHHKELSQLEILSNKLQSDGLFRQWTAINDSSRYLLQGDTSNIEELLAEMESILANTTNCDLIDYSFIPDSTITLGELNHHQPIVYNDAYTIRKQYYSQLTSIPCYTFDINILPRFMHVNKSHIYLCNSGGNVVKYEYLPPTNFHLRESFALVSNNPIKFLSCFAVTLNHIVSYEKNTDYMMIHNHQGIFEKKIQLDYKPKDILSSFDNDEFWICNNIQKICHSYRVDDTFNVQKLELIEYNNVQPVHLYRNKNHLAIHDSRSSNNEAMEATEDFLLIHNSLNPSKNRPTRIPLDFIKHQSNLPTTRLFHPIIDNQGFVILKHVPNITHSTEEELVVIDTNNPKEPLILNRIKLSCVFGIDFTDDNRLILGVGPLHQQRKILIF